MKVKIERLHDVPLQVVHTADGDAFYNLSDISERLNVKPDLQNGAGAWSMGTSLNPCSLTKLVQSSCFSEGLRRNCKRNASDRVAVYPCFTVAVIGDFDVPLRHKFQSIQAVAMYLVIPNTGDMTELMDTVDCFYSDGCHDDRLPSL